MRPPVAVVKRRLGKPAQKAVRARAGPLIGYVLKIPPKGKDSDELAATQGDLNPSIVKVLLAREDAIKI